MALEFFIAKTNKRGETFLFPFASALDNNDFHVSLHDPSYGLHLKVSHPYKIQSEPIKYEKFGEMIKEAQPKLLKQIVRLPEKGHEYYWIIPKFDDYAIKSKEKPNLTVIMMKGPLLTGFEMILKGETHFIPRDFINLRNCHDPSLVTGFVPDTKELFYFIPLSTDQIDSLADIVEDFDCNLYSKINGIFITISQDNGIDIFRESLPRLFKIVNTFFKKAEEEGLNLYDTSRLLRLFNVPTDNVPAELHYTCTYP